MLNWWEGNRFMMPGAKGTRYQPGLLDIKKEEMTKPPASPFRPSQPSADTGSGLDGDSLGGFEGVSPAPSQAAAATGKSSIGSPSYASTGNVVGTALGLATGFTPAGVVGNAIGTAVDTSLANDDMEAIGVDPTLSGLSAWGAGLGFGLAGKAGLGSSLDDQAFAATGLSTRGLSDLAKTGFTTSMGLNDVVKGIADLEAPQVTGGWSGVPGAVSAQDIADRAGVRGGLSDPGYADPGLAPAAQAAARSENPGYGVDPNSVGGTETDPGISSTDGAAGVGAGYDGPWNKGGVLPRRRDTVSGPDDQVITAKSGEGIIRSEAVDHYGPGLIGAINKMRIPKKKLQGLLGARP